MSQSEHLLHMNDQPLRSYPRFADAHLYELPRLQWSWWHRYCYLLVCAGFPPLQQCWNLSLRKRSNERGAESEQRRYRLIQCRFTKSRGQSLAGYKASVSPHKSIPARHQRTLPCTFRPFDEFDFSNFFCCWFPAENIEADDSTCLLKSLNSLTVCHFPHIDIIHK